MGNWLNVRIILAVVFFLAYFFLCLITIGFSLTVFSLLISAFVTIFIGGESGQRRTNMFRDRYWINPKITASDAIGLFLIIFLICTGMFLLSHLALTLGLALGLSIFAIIFLMGLLFSIILAKNLSRANARGGSNYV